ncbi:type I-B CRISPR-associated protein Cas5b [Herbivorax sp. ANBcel31]|uniref:type I-B CRISPR-associated protein Cas5b n=1 Tax=Herbivorax sp. ANBcel31 TaxID=3069754 RepID=UPI0027B17D31|nr:type I-B CRISPR-associated protein Cas5b [Herbivorax sp. ANBcel31]MDQ2085338.1 type I-B CRISPR-associated protein Cas5b [Herbivorax sp. ANBcel31]
MIEKYLAFDIWSLYGHFKKPYTTTSPLTYSVPTRTAITGIIAAMIGLDKNEYCKHFTKKKAKIGVCIKNPIKKVRISENFINTKKSLTKIHERSQIKVEYLKDSCYRIYFSHEDEKIYDKLKDVLKNHNSVYTISMGLSENLANYKFVGEFQGDEVTDNNEFVEISSILPLTGINKGDIVFEDGKEYFTETIPLEMDETRHVKEYGEVLFERNSKEIKACIKSYISFSNENITII